MIGRSQQAGPFGLVVMLLLLPLLLLALRRLRLSSKQVSRHECVHPPSFSLVFLRQLVRIVAIMRRHVGRNPTREDCGERRGT